MGDAMESQAQSEARTAEEATLTVVLSVREARALAQAAELLLAARWGVRLPRGTATLDIAHLRLVNAIERQEVAP